MNDWYTPETRPVIEKIIRNGFFSLADRIWAAWRHGEYIQLSEEARSNLKWMGVLKEFDRINGDMWLGTEK